MRRGRQRADRRRAVEVPVGEIDPMLALGDESHRPVAYLHPGCFVTLPEHPLHDRSRNILDPEVETRAPGLHEVDSPAPEEILEHVPSKDEVIEHARTADEVVDEQPSLAVADGGGCLAPEPDRECPGTSVRLVRPSCSA
jgi:hypothetical protein